MASVSSERADRLRILLLLAPALVLLTLLIVAPTATMVRYSFNTYIGEVETPQVLVSKTGNCSFRTPTTTWGCGKRYALP